MASWQLLRIVLSLCILLSIAQEAVTVQTSCGPVQGINNEGLPSFRGINIKRIRYGKPPTGQYRWQGPRAAECWQGVYNATGERNVCWQALGYTPPSSIFSEDCLFLDVYSRFTSRGKRSKSVPVIYWIYGGSNIMGSTTAYPDLDQIARKLDVVLVAPNYRLGLLGYLALDELSEADPRGVSGNYGILDLLLGLEWVQKNIPAFGGDPTRVTLFGQSSGGTNIYALLASPASQGLFHSAYSLSGSPNISMSYSAANTFNRPLLDTLGCKQGDINKRRDCLLALPPQTLVNDLPVCYQSATFSELPVDPDSGDFCPLLIADGVTVKNLESALKKGVMDVPLVVQTLWAEPDMMPNAKVEKMSVAHFTEYMTSFWDNHGYKPNPIHEILKLYSEELSVTPQFALTSFLGDIYMLCGNLKVTTWASEGFTSPVYSSVINYSPSHPFGPLIPGTTIKSLYPFHMWDYFSLVEAYGFYNYTPSATDLKFGMEMRNSLNDIVYHGKMPSYWSPFNHARGFPDNYMVGYFNDISSFASKLNVKKDVCEGLAKWGFDYSFWIDN